MPKLNLRTAAEAPKPRRVARPAQEQQRLYESYIRSIGENVGELHLAPDEEIRSVKARLSRAASRLGTRIERWDADGKVYFRAWSPRRTRASATRAGASERALET
jgi:hypothetical protein